MTYKIRNTLTTFFIAALALLTIMADANAADKSEIDHNVAVALDDFNALVGTSEALIKRAKGILIFPRVKTSSGRDGVASGTGALLVDGKIVAYYESSTNTFGNRVAYNERSEVVLFMTNRSLKVFREAKEWEVGMNVTVNMIGFDSAGKLTTQESPIIGIIFGHSGLLFNYTFDSTKVSRIQP